MKILVLNCGSSSLKYQLINMETEQVIAKGNYERIGTEKSFITHKVNGEKYVTEKAAPTHKEALEFIIEQLTKTDYAVIKDLNEINAIGHRVVHGGEKFADPVLVDDDVVAGIRECAELAPVHNMAAAMGIEACRNLMPNKPNVVVFDNGFHQTIPEERFLYPIPYHYYRDYKIRKYGFHGTSHSFVSKRLAELIGRDIKDTKLIVCHLGNGASISAVKDGKCVDTSMGLTPLEGLVMGTRSGDIDPAIMEYIAKKENLDIAGVMNVLNKKSGVLGLSGVSSDFRDLEEAAAAGNDRAEKALKAYNYRVVKYIGAYTAAMDGVDVIAFTAGLGGNQDRRRGQQHPRQGCGDLHSGLQGPGYGDPHQRGVSNRKRNSGSGIRKTDPAYICPS